MFKVPVGLAVTVNSKPMKISQIIFSQQIKVFFKLLNRIFTLKNSGYMYFHAFKSEKEIPGWRGGGGGGALAYKSGSDAHRLYFDLT